MRREAPQTRIKLSALHNLIVLLSLSTVSCATPSRSAEAKLGRAEMLKTRALAARFKEDLIGAYTAHFEDESSPEAVSAEQQWAGMLHRLREELAQRIAALPSQDPLPLPAHMPLRTRDLARLEADLWVIGDSVT